MKHVSLSSLLLVSTSCVPDGPPVGAALRFGGMYSELSGTSSIDGLQLVADEVNQAGILDLPVEIVSEVFSDQTDRSTQTRGLIDNEGVVGVISEFSSTALAILQVTNTPDYETIVSCSGSSTNTTINNPATADIGGLPGSDKNDTLYRTVTNDILQARVVYQLIEDTSKVAVFTIDDPYGSTFRIELEGHAADSANPLIINQTIATDANQANLQAAVDAALAASLEGTVRTVVIVGFIEHTAPMIKALVEAPNPFEGAIIVTDGPVLDGTFVAQTAALTGWLEVAGNSLRATTPDSRHGVNSAAWFERYAAATGRSPDAIDLFVASHSDCLYSMLIGLAQGQAEGATGAVAIKLGMTKQKAGQRTAEVVDVPPSAEGLAAAMAAIADGKAVRLNGASGVVEYDDDGDRVSQNYEILVASGEGPYSWTAGEVWDPTIGSCVQFCDD